MKASKQFVLSYGLHLILVLSILRLLITFQFGGAYREYEIIIAVISLLIIAVVMYVQREENSTVVERARTITKAAKELAKANALIAEELRRWFLKMPTKPNQIFSPI